jgi:hypothetical protein
LNELESARGALVGRPVNVEMDLEGFLAGLAGLEVKSEEMIWGFFELDAACWDGA